MGKRRQGRSGITRTWSAALARFAAEPLERRVLLSVTAATLFGPINVTGTHWEYATTNAAGDTNTFIETAAGPTTFNGNACFQIDVGSTGASHIYEGFDGAGNLLGYGGFIQTPTVLNKPVAHLVASPVQAGCIRRGAFKGEIPE